MNFFINTSMSTIEGTLGIELVTEPEPSDVKSVQKVSVIDDKSRKQLVTDIIDDSSSDLTEISDNATAMALQIMNDIDIIEPSSKARTLEVAAELLKTSVSALKQKQDVALKELDRIEKNGEGDGQGINNTQNNQFNFYGSRNDIMNAIRKESNKEQKND